MHKRVYVCVSTRVVVYMNANPCTYQSDGLLVGGRGQRNSYALAIQGERRELLQQSHRTDDTDALEPRLRVINLLANGDT